MRESVLRKFEPPPKTGCQANMGFTTSPLIFIANTSSNVRPTRERGTCFVISFTGKPVNALRRMVPSGAKFEVAETVAIVEPFPVAVTPVSVVVPRLTRLT